MKDRAVLPILITTLIILIALAVYFYPTKPLTDTQLKHGTRLNHPVAVKTFQLISDKDQPFTTNELKNKWSLLFFGFTHCTTVCPVTLSELNKAYAKLKQKDLVQVVFVTVDPKRDTPKQLQHYLQHFKGNFIGVTGSPKELEQFRKQFGIYAHDAEHSGVIIVINPQGQWAAVLSAPQYANNIAHDINLLQSQSDRSAA